jgi:D-serine deaminase-like pyridoxal phosphate-dependent protein
MADLVADLVPRCETDEPIITAGGSAYFDRVVELLGPAAAATGSRLVLRSGSYVIHDDGLYAGRTPSATRSGPRFVAAAHVWARVLSVPEPGLALLDAGKRDVAYDAGLPRPLSIVRDHRSGPDRQVLASGTVTDINDQHAFWRPAEPAPAAVGDLVQLGLSHPCTIFDKWRSALLVQGQLAEGQPPRVLGAVPTYF